MAKYKFKNFSAVIDSPTLISFKVLDDVKEKTAQVFPIFSDASGNEYAVDIEDVFIYEDTWSDPDIESWILDKMQSFAIESES